jgi:hypothetical protein
MREPLGIEVAFICFRQRDQQGCPRVQPFGPDGKPNRDLLAALSGKSCRDVVLFCWVTCQQADGQQPFCADWPSK